MSENNYSDMTNNGLKEEKKEEYVKTSVRN